MKILVAQNPGLFLRVASCAAEAVRETTSQTKAMTNGVHCVEKELELTALSAFQATVIAPVMAAKFVSDWTVRNSLTLVWSSALRSDVCELLGLVFATEVNSGSESATIVSPYLKSATEGVMEPSFHCVSSIEPMGQAVPP